MHIIQFIGLLGFLACCSVTGHHDDHHYGHCKMTGTVEGHICFRQLHNEEEVQADLHLKTGKITDLSHVNIHVHQNHPVGHGCTNVGNRLGGEHGNLGEFTPNENCIIHEQKGLPGLSLHGPNKILGGSIVIHLPDGKRECCKIVNLDETRYRTMTASGNADQENHCK